MVSYLPVCQRVKRNLHIVLAMSPAGSLFRQRCRMNPSLINCCTIDWYQDWDAAAMLSVAQVYFQGVDFGTTSQTSDSEIEDVTQSESMLNLMVRGIERC